MLETVSGSMMFAAPAFALWIALLAARTSRRRRDARMRDAFFTPPTQREINAARRWLRQELEVTA